MSRWSLVLSLTLFGCTTEDVPLGTTSADTGASDTARPDTFVADTAADVSRDTDTVATDTSSDAALPVNATITAEYLFQNCSVGAPIKPDPVHLKATISLENLGSASLGTVTSAKGKFINGGVVIATFTFPEVSIAVPAMMTSNATFEKTADSVDPKGACATLPCGGMVTIEVTLSGPGATIVARSAETYVECPV